MSSMISFWDLIVKSNTFNFIILVIICFILAEKLKINDVVEKIKSDIIAMLEAAKTERENAQKSFTHAKSLIEHLEDEISERLELADKQAENVANSINEASARKLAQIEKNMAKVIEAEEKTLITTLTEKTASSSVELARKYIISRLENEPELHNKYIEEAIEELEKV